MPIETRPIDQFTTDHLLLGFSIVSFQRLKADGTYDAAVDLGILADEVLQKEVESLELPDGSSGTITVAREIVTRINPTLQLELFNFHPSVAEFIFGSSAGVDVVADAAKVVTNDLINIPTTDPERTFAQLANADVDEASLGASAVTCAPIVDEAVGTGDGTSGDTAGDFVLDYKPLVVGDVSSVTVDGVAYTPVAVGGAVSGNEVAVAVGTGATSGELQFFQGGSAVNVTGAILASYTPSHAFANLTDYVVDPSAGRIRFLNVDGTTDALKGGQPMHVDYQYNQRSGVNLKPFTRNSVSGKALIRHLPDVGINFRWPIPSATIALTADDLQFGAEDFARGVLQMTINDAGGSDRFGTLFLASESQAAA